MTAPPTGPSTCLTTGDGYLRAHLAGAIEENVDWPNSGTRCEGESRDKPPGVRLSFQRAHAGKTDLLFVFGITGVHEGKATREAGVNLTIIVQGTSRIYGTLGDSRCTADSLKQRPLDKPGLYRVEARGFCTQPAHAVRGEGELILIVDDEKKIRDTIRDLLVKYGYQVITASDGAEAAMEYARHGKDIKVVITDLEMPIMNGVTLVQVLKRMNPAVTAIVSSGVASVEGMEQRRKELELLGVKQILSKPYTVDEILSALAQIRADSKERL